MNYYNKVDHALLNKKERRALALMRLNCWEWDEEVFGPKPKGWDEMETSPRRWRDKLLYAMGKKTVKYDYVMPKLEMGWAEFSEEERTRCVRLIEKLNN